MLGVPSDEIILADDALDGVAHHRYVLCGLWQVIMEPIPKVPSDKLKQLYLGLRPACQSIFPNLWTSALRVGLFFWILPPDNTGKRCSGCFRNV